MIDLYESDSLIAHELNYLTAVVILSYLNDFSS